MKAIIPVAGAGTQLRPHTYTQPKPLIPVAGKPIISFIIDQLLEVGIEEFVFVIGYLGEKIQLYVEEHYPALRCAFVQQQERLGLGHAVWVARKEVGADEEVFIVLGDTIFDADIGRMLAEPSSCLAIKQVPDPWNFGIVEFGKDGMVSKVVEKTKIPKSDWAMVGLYKVKEVGLLWEVIGANILENRRTLGEFQLTDGLMGMIEQGVRFSTVAVDNWFDCGKREVLLETNAMLLDKGGYASAEIPNFDNTIIIHPVSIGAGCMIRNAIIGPHVTIGDNTEINYAIVKDSIIGSYARIEEVVLRHSLVGSDAAIRGLGQSLNIGDNTEIDFR